MSNCRTADLDTVLLAAIRPLADVDPSDRVAAPPQRLPMSETRECQVIWQADSVGGEWSLVLHARSPDVRDQDMLIARCAVHLPLDGLPSIHWEDADSQFCAFVANHFSAIVCDLADRQPAELAVVRSRAGLSDRSARKLGAFIPHLVALGGLAAFAYMFGIVHIK
jgi:hypothetical protein